jgi:glycine dehydrogenase subunit 2
MERIAQEARENPQLLRDAPLTTPVSRLDEARAARELVLTWRAGAPTPAPATEAAARS